MPLYPGIDVGKQTKKQQKREQRRRDKESRRRHRQDTEWKRQHPRREVSTEDLRRQVEQIEAKERMRRNNLAPLGLAAALIAMCSSTDKGNLP